MVRDAEAHAADDKLKKDRIEASNQVRFCHCTFSGWFIWSDSIGWFCCLEIGWNGYRVNPTKQPNKPPCIKHKLEVSRHVNSKVTPLYGNLGPKSWYRILEVVGNERGGQSLPLALDIASYIARSLARLQLRNMLLHAMQVMQNAYLFPDCCLSMRVLDGVVSTYAGPQMEWQALKACSNGGDFLLLSTFHEYLNLCKEAEYWFAL